MSADAKLLQIVHEVANEQITEAMRDGSIVAFDMAISLALDLATRPELSPQQADVLNGFAQALRSSADEFLARTIDSTEATS